MFQVTWTRRLSGDSGLQLLSVGDFTHVSDPRFVVSKIPNDNVSKRLINQVTEGWAFESRISCLPMIFPLWHCFSSDNAFTRLRATALTGFFDILIPRGLKDNRTQE